MNDVSVVVCARNCAELLPPSLASILENEPAELVVVDGRSTDDTVAVASRYTDRILQDEGKGLAYARNLGAEAATAANVSFVGPDNILPAGTLQTMIETKRRQSWSGVSAATRLWEPAGYLARSMDRYKSYRFRPGERSVIGTPTLFSTEVLRSFMFDATLTSSDDADLCERMVAAGLKLGIADVVVYEQGTENFSSVMERWRWYGESDAQFYAKYSRDWSLRRKTRSLLHPLRDELLHPAAAAVRHGDVATLPFLAFVTAVRYAAWAGHAPQQQRRRP